MVRQYDDCVQVRRGVLDGTEGPEQILWRERVYVVRAVLGHWMQTGPWWQSSSLAGMYGATPAPERSTNAPAAAAQVAVEVALLDPAEREVWRVEARAGRLGPTVVLDLALDTDSGQWHVLCSHD